MDGYHVSVSVSVCVHSCLHNMNIRPYMYVTAWRCICYATHLAVARLLVEDPHPLLGLSAGWSKALSNGHQTNKISMQRWGGHYLD
jgi:hypothetical protein